jgi:hypothetical protein
LEIRRTVTEKVDTCLETDPHWRNGRMGRTASDHVAWPLVNPTVRDANTFARFGCTARNRNESNRKVITHCGPAHCKRLDRDWIDRRTLSQWDYEGAAVLSQRAEEVEQATTAVVSELTAEPVLHWSAVVKRRARALAEAG